MDMKQNKNNVFLWEIADAMNMAEATFLKKLRKELDAEQKAKIFKVIEELAQAQSEKVTKGGDNMEKICNNCNCEKDNEDSFAMELLRDYKKQNRRWFCISLTEAIAIVLLVCLVLLTR